jgi:Fur family transcriptional regulator, ferric uptake regulator
VSQTLAEVLRARGLRLTAQRQLVLEAVHELGHATPDQVHAKVSAVAAGVNITTVYRSLELLEELGLVTHAHLSHGAPTYHAVGAEQHVHLVCRACGGVSEVPSGTLTALAGTLEAERGFLVDLGHVALFGVCAGCGSGDGGSEHE